MGINYIAGEPRPWFICAPINIEDSIKKNETASIPEIDPNWEPTEENLNVRAATKEEEERHYQSSQLKQRLIAINAEDLASDLTEKQQWTLVETMDSILYSMIELSQTPWADYDKTCGAVYGQNLAKIDFAGRILGSDYKDKLKEALDWYAQRTILVEKNMFQIDPGSADYQKFVQVFQQTGSFIDAASGADSLETNSSDINKNALQFKSSLQEALLQLRLSFADKNIYESTKNGFKEIVFEPMIINDWDKYFSKLISHNVVPTNLSAYILRCDVTA